MSIPETIKNRFNHALIQDCTDKGCCLSTNGLQDCIMLKGELLSTSSIADCMVFWFNGRLFVGIVELKGKASDANKIADQLHSASDKALEILRSCNINGDFEIFHIVLSRSWRPIENTIIGTKRIKVNGKMLKIITRKCGDSFVEIVRTFSKTSPLNM